MWWKICWCLCVSSTVFSQSAIPDAVHRLVNDPHLANGAMSIAVYDIQNKNYIATHQHTTALPPASAVKLFATASAIELLGKEFRPQTRIYFSEALSKSGTLKGNITVRGGGDASLGSRYYNGEGKEREFLLKWADSLYAKGLRKVTGNVIADASEFSYNGAPDGWNWADMGNYYGSGPSGLPIFDNLLRYYFKVGGIVGAQSTLIKTFPEVEGLFFKNDIVGRKGGGDNAYIYGAPYSLDRFGTGTLPTNSSMFMVKSTLPDPELQFAVEMKKALIERGIEVEGKALGVRKMEYISRAQRYPENNPPVLTHYGASIQSISNWTNMRSVNLFAEQLICLIGHQKSWIGSTESGLNKVRAFWSGKINASGLYLTDGSGLSRSNAVSARHFCEMLTYMHGSKNSEAFLETLPVAGESGTLSKVCYKQAGHGRVKAKSGTMKRIKTYAGYVYAQSGKTYAFCIILNNFTCSAEGALSRMETLMNAIARE